MAALAAVHVSEIPANAEAELDRFWTAHPDLRKLCTGRYGYDPVHEPLGYWRFGLAEPEHDNIRARVEGRGGVFTLRDVRQWEKEELAHADLEKAGIPAWAHYREASKAGTDCGTCDFYGAGRCEMFENAPVEADFVCDRWEGRIDKAEHDPLYAGTRPTSSHNAATWDPADLALVASLTESLEPGRLSDGLAKADGVKAAGIAVRAADTGRVLMIQRSSHDSSDPAAGKWEFPGGRLEEGEHPREAAKREWQEEMGIRLPRGRHVAEWRHRVYQGFVHEVAHEGKVRLNLHTVDRAVLNPDDPDGDNVEVAAWWHPDDMKGSGAVRDELRASRAWRKVAKGAGALYLISHAKTRYNRPGQPHDIVQGWRDIPLDADGRAQAAKLGGFLKEHGVETVYTSSLKRALQTAQIAAKAAGVKVVSDPALRPWNLGEFAGHSSADVLPKL